MKLDYFLNKLLGPVLLIVLGLILTFSPDSASALIAAILGWVLIIAAIGCGIAAIASPRGRVGKVLCAIDLDTVMSSTSLNDFGDAIRSYANTGAEDDQNLDNVEMSLDMFRAYAEGYLSEQRDTMSASELEWLAFSAIYITFEQVLRFLMDYMDGEKYWKTAYTGHTLVRTHAQYKLLQSMERQYPEMQKVIKEIQRRH